MVLQVVPVACAPFTSRRARGAYLRARRRGRRRDGASLRAARGATLLEVGVGNMMKFSGDHTALDERLDELSAEREVSLLLHRGPWPSPAEARRQLHNALEAPEDEVSILDAETLLSMLRRSTIFGRKPLRSLAELPAGACLYLNHPLFRVRALGGLLSLPPARVRELDLSDNALHDVGTALSHYQSLTELRLAGNAIESIELSHMPRLLLLDLARNRLPALPELVGLAALRRLDLGENAIGSRAVWGESADGWERFTHSPLSEARRRPPPPPPPAALPLPACPPADPCRLLPLCPSLQLRVLRLYNNQLHWDQQLFASRIEFLREKKNLLELDLAGNPMGWAERPDGKPALKGYREGILAQCPRLRVLDAEPVTKREREWLAARAAQQEDGDGFDSGFGGVWTAALAGDDDDGDAPGAAAAAEDDDGWEYSGGLRASPLALHIEILATAAGMPPKRTVQVPAPPAADAPPRLTRPPNPAPRPSGAQYRRRLLSALRGAPRSSPHGCRLCRRRHGSRRRL